MKKILSIILCAVCTVFSSGAQDGGPNSSADNIAGLYFVSHEGENSKVRISRDTDGTFKAQVIWLENRMDSDGNVRLDEKNPDKSLKDTPCDRIVIIEKLSYNPDRQRWEKGKIYDPTRGIRANATCSFDSPDTLRIRGSLMGIGETVFWKKLE